jgi:hypothetical protein
LGGISAVICQRLHRRFLGSQNQTGIFYRLSSVAVLNFEWTNRLCPIKFSLVVGQKSYPAQVRIFCDLTNGHPYPMTMVIRISRIRNMQTESLRIALSRKRLLMG